MRRAADAVDGFLSEPEEERRFAGSSFGSASSGARQRGSLNDRVGSAFDFCTRRLFRAAFVQVLEGEEGVLGDMRPCFMSGVNVQFGNSSVDAVPVFRVAVYVVNEVVGVLGFECVGAWCRPVRPGAGIGSGC